MAIFDKYNVKEITEFFENLGYPIIFFNSNDESGEYRQDERGYNIKYYNSPITIKGVNRNDEWNIFFTSKVSGRAYNFNEYFGVENGKLQLLRDNPSYFRLELVDSGSKFLNEEEIDLAEYESSNEFANFENFDDIDAPDYSSIYGDDPQISVATPPVNIEELTASQIKKAQEKLEASKKALADLKEAEKNGDIETAMWTFDEVDELYNAKITTDDKRAYFIYLQNKCGKKLGGDWGEKYGSSYPAKATDIFELLKKGALFFDPTAKIGERLQPKVIYQSGNIWKKWGSLTNKKEDILKRFGQDIYDLHVSALEPIWQELNKNRLSVRSEDKSMRLHLIPISSLAEDIKINSIVSPKDKATIEQNFKVYTSFKKGERVEDLVGDEGGSARLNFINKKVISLYEGFILWCREAGSGLQSAEYGIQWSSITTGISELKDYYLRPVSNPFSKEKNSEEKWARYKDDARKVGERLFAQFLAEGITPEDQMKVEYIWNSIYNAYVEPNLELVPIGFTYKKYLDNRHLFVLKESNLRAIRYYLTRGSIGLAYGVGLGKTFCSIFAMKQALDLGTAKRPLVIVPNQVYEQFGQEILRGLGSDFDPTKQDSRLNMFDNGGGIFNSLGNNAVDGINLCTYEATEAFQFAKENLDYSWVEDAVGILEMGSEIKNEPIVEGFLKAHSKGLFNEETIEFDADLSDEYDNEPSADIEPNNQDFTDEDDMGGFGEGGKVEKKKRVIEPIIINSESTNYDMIVVDEAHNFNNLFTSVVAEPKKIQTGNKDKKSGKIKIQREKNPYSSIRETSGGKDSSARAEKLWFIARFIQHYNKMGNTILLSATPFTNSPLQIYSMLSYLNYNMLYDAELGIIKDFFDTYAKIEYTDDFRTDLTIVKRNKFIGWTNLISLQKYVYRVFDKSSREEEDKAVVRPNKWVLPLKRMMVDGKLIEFAKSNFISTTIRMSDVQLELWNRVRSYAQGNLSYEELCNETNRNTTSFGLYKVKPTKKVTTTDTEEGGSAEVDIEDADNLADGTKEGEKAKATAKALQCLMWGRQIALNPYLFKCSGFKQEPTARMYVEQSPKLLYTMECIKTIKEYTEANDIGYMDYSDKDNPRRVSDMSGQVIYMNFGTKAFELLRDYLVEVVGFNIDEIGIIRGDGNYIGKKRYDSKQIVADAFLGRVYDSSTKKYKPLANDKRVKVLIGSESIKEGINLQDYASVLYNCFLDFNPTDMVQVEGRIWRQGNALKNVRIVTPLMADCIDIFMFQKLEDKTERINQIWTKNGNSNELDTTAFNPAELKYELLTDPVAIAKLEREYKKDKIEEQKTREGEILSGYLAIESVFKKSLEIKYMPIDSDIKQDFRFRMHYAISQIRPDLIDKPLVNAEYFPTYLKGVWEENKEKLISAGMSLESMTKESKNIYQLIDSSYVFRFIGYNSPYNVVRNQVNQFLWRNQLDKLFNYSVEDLIELMVKVLKEQKIGYPLGYSKNWRELIPEKQLPIVEGDEVEFDTKKGRKKGIAELVMNNNRVEILQVFFTNLKSYALEGGQTNYDIFKRAKEEQNLKNLEWFNVETSFDSLDKSQKSILAKLLKWYYQNDSSDFVLDEDSKEIYDAYVPFELDADEFEDLNIEDRNIVLVQKEDKAKKKVEPTKYPEPFVWSNKDRNENLKDISEYIGTMLIPKLGNDIQPNNYNRYIEEYVSMNPTEMIPQGSDEIYSMPQIVKVTSNGWNANTFKTTEFDSVIDSWALLVDAWKDANRGGLFKDYYRRFYSVDLPLTLAEFKTIEQKKMQPLGINNYQDVENLILTQKTKINTLALESKQLDDDQVFQELVEEVIRRIEELNSEEIRLGSSISARVASFANSNTDYLGNTMLSLFVPQSEEEQKEIKKKAKKEVPVPVVEEEVVVTDVVSEEDDFEIQTREFIAQLKPLLPLSKGKEKKELQEYINSIEALLTIG
jgi:hypothetical protein